MRPFVLLLTFSLSVFATPVAELSLKTTNTLVLVHVLFRHGNRTPDLGSTFPTDIYTEKTYDPFGYGQLTKKGKVTEYNIGHFLRQTYDTLIPKQYTPNAVYAISTNVKRTKMSLQLVLAGLFPPQASDKFNAFIEWQPISYQVETNTHLIDNPQTSCFNYLNQYNEYVQSDEASERIAIYQSLYDTIGKFTGLKINTPRDLASVYFTLKSEDDFGLKLPEWSKNYYPQVLEDASSIDYEFQTGTHQMKKLISGFLLQKIIDDTKQLINGTLPSERKAFLYSAHEFNVAAMLRTLNVYYSHIPPFGASIFFEIHKIDGVYGLKLFYQDYKETNPKFLTIPGCASFCSIEQVESLVKNNLPGPDDVCASSGEF